MNVTEQPVAICMIIPWFGPWPPWIRPFLESCRWNPTVDWLIFGDARPPEDVPPNVRIVTTSFQNYRRLIANRLAIEPRWHDAYKLCDLKPALGFIHQLEIAGYDYWGFGDLDVIYGDIRRFMTPAVLSHDIVSAHAHIVAGHFSLLRNSRKMVDAFMRLPGWRGMLASAEHKSFDEQIFSQLFMRMHGRRAWRRFFVPRYRNAHFEEQYSTNLSSMLRWIDGGSEFPRCWYWDRGHLTTDRSGEREFLYLHFSHWQSNRWTEQAVAPWRKLDPLVRLPDGRPTGFTVSAEGFTPLPAEALAA